MGPTWIQSKNVASYPPFQVQWNRKLGLQWQKHAAWLNCKTFSPWWWKSKTMGQNSKLCFIFICLTNKFPITDILYSVPYWSHDCVLQNLTIVLLALYMYKPEDCGYFYSWCKFCIDFYAWYKFSLSMVSNNYKVYWRYWLVFLPLWTSYGIAQRW